MIAAALLDFYSMFRLGYAVWQIWDVRLYIPLFVFAACMLVLAAAVQRKHSHSRRYRQGVWLSGIYICLLVYFLLYLAVADVVSAVWNLPAHTSGVNGILVAAAAAASALTVIYGVLHAGKLKTVRYSFSVGRGKDDYRIVHLSDLHFGVIIGPAHMERVVNAVNELKPDMVVITGDIFNSAYLEECVDCDKIAEQFRRLQTKDGVFAILGNHDPDRKNPALNEFIKKAGIRLIDNEVAAFSRFYLVGRTGIIDKGKERMTLESLLQNINREKPVIVLDHDPQEIREAAECKADLVLCGHTHRGQFFPFTLFTKWANGKEYFYGYRIYGNGRTRGVISAGTGYFQLPVRVGTDSEIVCLDMKI